MDAVKKVGIPLDEEELKEVSGGFGGKNPDDSCWIYGTVHGVVHYDSSSCLVRDSMILALDEIADKLELAIEYIFKPVKSMY